MLASSASLTQLTVTTMPYKAQPLRPPLLSFDGSAGELLVSHHASSRTPLPAHTARKHCSCFSAANSAFRYAEKGSVDPSKVLEKEQERVKAKAKEKERATNKSCTIHFPSHRTGITPMAAASPYRRTRLPLLHRYIPTHLLHIRHWQLHHLGAPAWLPFHNSWIRYLGNTSDGFTI